MNILKLLFFDAALDGYEATLDPVRLPRQQAVLLLEEHVRETPVHRQVLDLDQDQR